MALRYPGKRLLLSWLIKGVIANIISIAIKIVRLTGSRNKLVNAIILIGKRHCIYLLFVSLGIKTASAKRGVKFPGRPINLLATNKDIRNIEFLIIVFPCLILM